MVTETNASASTGGTDVVYSSLAAYTLGANVENGGISTFDAANLSGNSLGNTLYAGSGDNVFDGSAGTDTVSYNKWWNDAVTVSLVLTTAQATGGSGSDTFVSIENLTGSYYNDSLTGNSGANVLNGGAGTDTMVGGNGSDTYYVDNTSDVVTESNATVSTGGTDTVYSYLTAYTLGSNVENGRILSTGSANLSGNSLANTLYAGTGSNVLNGSTGTDTVSYLYGLVSGTTAGVSVSLALTTAQATGSSGSDTLIGVENLTGSSRNDSLTGNSGTNVLNGGAGADTMAGGNGSDTYYVDNTSDVVTESNATVSTGGTDTVYSYLTAYTLGSNVENGRILSTGSANLSGNSLANTLYAGTGNNVLNGSTGTDTVSYLHGLASGTTAGVSVSLALTTAQATGSSSSDTLIGVENLTGSNHNDILTGNAGANVLNGGLGNDSLSGGDGNDLLIGGAGKDALTGGNGNDIFDFNTLSEMGTTSTTRDRIVDFVRGQDKIDLSTLDANTATTANDAFNSILIAPTASFAAAGQLKLTSGVLYGNTDADVGAEFAIELAGITALAASDLVL